MHCKKTTSFEFFANWSKALIAARGLIRAWSRTQVQFIIICLTGLSPHPRPSKLSSVSLLTVFVLFPLAIFWRLGWVLKRGICIVSSRHEMRAVFILWNEQTFWTVPSCFRWVTRDVFYCERATHCTSRFPAIAGHDNLPLTLDLQIPIDLKARHRQYNPRATCSFSIGKKYSCVICESSLNLIDESKTVRAVQIKTGGIQVQEMAGGRRQSQSVECLLSFDVEPKGNILLGTLVNKTYTQS